MNVRQILAKNYINFRGWKTNRKIVVIESDDWGSIRMGDSGSYNKLLEKGVPVNKSYFTKYDSLESNEDISELQTVLSKFKDINGRHPILTLNAVVANPDYKKIKESNFTKYFYESIEDSYQNSYSDSRNVLKAYRDCIDSNSFFKPQFHGREHLNVRKFMSNLSNGSRFDLLGIEYNSLLGLVEGEQIKSREFYHDKNYMAGFETLDKNHEKEIENITLEGLKLFKTIFNIDSKSFVAQSLIWGDHLLPVLTENKVKYIQGAQQFVPLSDGKLKVRNNFSGKKTAFNQTLWRRNASFEPSSNPNKDWVNQTLEEINIAFKWNAPAVINSHRVNFIGSINKENRENSLKKFDELLEAIIKKWPNVEFFSSDELGDLMK